MAGKVPGEESSAGPWVILLPQVKILARRLHLPCSWIALLSGCCRRPTAPDRPRMTRGLPEEEDSASSGAESSDEEEEGLVAALHKWVSGTHRWHVDRSLEKRPNDTFHDLGRVHASSSRMTASHATAWT
jgi:hypothetical protein